MGGKNLRIVLTKKGGARYRTRFLCDFNAARKPPTCGEKRKKKEQNSRNHLPRRNGGGEKGANAIAPPEKNRHHNRGWPLGTDAEEKKRTLSRITAKRKKREEKGEMGWSNASAYAPVTGLEQLETKEDKKTHLMLSPLCSQERELGPKLLCRVPQNGKGEEKGHTEEKENIKCYGQSGREKGGGEGRYSYTRQMTPDQKKTMPVKASRMAGPEVRKREGGIARCNSTLWPEREKKGGAVPLPRA